VSAGGARGFTAAEMHRRRAALGRELDYRGTGELLLVADHGPQRLHRYPPGLQQVG
jgi:hypothetical protein